jgi:DNA-binding transcriptional LysR family regulator
MTSNQMRDLNRSAEMELLVRVVELGGFSAAARASGMTPSGVSKLITRLETRLGARLLNRSTRSLFLTQEGRVFYERCVRILADIDDAEREAAAASRPRGAIRVTVNIPFAMHYLLPVLPGFLTENPEISIDLTMSDQVADLFEAQTDVAVRTGPLRSSQLTARKLGESGMAVVAAPSYLARNGRPNAVPDLVGHNCIGFSFPGHFRDWPFIDGDRIETFSPQGNLRASDGETLRRLALEGLGLARLALFHVGPDIESGRLIAVMNDLNPGDTQGVYAVFIGQGGNLPARVRAFIDYLATHIRVSNLAPMGT